MTVELDLTGEIALVTGAGRGIGERIATRLADAGADIVAAARTESELLDTVERVEATGTRGMAVPTDLSKVEAIEELVDTVVSEWRVPDTLVNNAGLNLTGPPLEHTTEEVDAMLDVNLRGLFLLSQRYGQMVRESGLERGQIVNVSSITSKLGVPHMTLYAGTNGGINSVTRGLAAELADDGVRVNCITPGLVRTDRIDALIEAKGDEIYDLSRVPLGRLGDARDVADACLFLVSDLADYVTGETLIVDGGVNFTAGLYK